MRTMFRAKKVLVRNVNAESVRFRAKAVRHFIQETIVCQECSDAHSILGISIMPFPHILGVQASIYTDLHCMGPGI